MPDPFEQIYIDQVSVKIYIWMKLVKTILIANYITDGGHFTTDTGHESVNLNQQISSMCYVIYPMIKKSND